MWRQVFYNRRGDQNYKLAVTVVQSNYYYTTNDQLHVNFCFSLPINIIRGSDSIKENSFDVFKLLPESLNTVNRIHCETTSMIYFIATHVHIASRNTEVVY